MATESDNYSINLFRALVVSDSDTESRGRLQIRVPSIHGIVGVTEGCLADKDLPWAYPIQIDYGVNSGVQIIPRVGSIVMVYFEDGDIDKPVYIGAVPVRKSNHGLGGTSLGVSTEILGVYQDSSPTFDVIFRSLNGLEISVNRDTGDIFLGIRQSTGDYDSGLLISSSLLSKTRLTCGEDKICGQYICGEWVESEDGSVYLYHLIRKVSAQTCGEDKICGQLVVGSASKVLYAANILDGDFALVNAL